MEGKIRKLGEDKKTESKGDNVKRKKDSMRNQTTENLIINFIGMNFT
jgi:hypothetical protein